MSVLIIDALNLFTRTFCAFPQVNTNGEQIGGTIGFLKTLRKLVDDMKPSAVYIAWEGGGSQRRREIYPEYKANRKPEKLNRFYEDDIPETEENRQNQILKLLNLLKTLPVCQLYVSGCEADDVVAQLCCNTLKNEDKIIASSDKDFYQLLDDKTKVWNFHKKLFVTKDDVFKEFRITSKNFAIAKALCGDKSDNITGISRLGFKTAVKCFPFLSTENDILRQDVVDYCHSHLNESKVYKTVLDEQLILERNWDLVFLNGSMLSGNQSTKIDDLISTFAPKSDKFKFIKLLAKEGVNNIDPHGFFMTFNCIKGLQYKTSPNNTGASSR
jgi:5'-3' exonuclease